MRRVKTSSKFPLKGKVRIELYDKDGNLKEFREKDNTFMDVGKAHVADQLSASPDESAMGYMAIGTSGTAFTAADTALHSEIDRNALNAGYPEQGTGANDNDVIYKATWGASPVPSLSEMIELIRWLYAGKLLNSSLPKSKNMMNAITSRKAYAG